MRAPPISRQRETPAVGGEGNSKNLNGLDASKNYDFPQKFKSGLKERLEPYIVLARPPKMYRTTGCVSKAR